MSDTIHSSITGAQLAASDAAFQAAGIGHDFATELAREFGHLSDANEFCGATGAEFPSDLPSEASNDTTTDPADIEAMLAASALAAYVSAGGVEFEADNTVAEPAEACEGSGSEIAKNEAAAAEAAAFDSAVIEAALSEPALAAFAANASAAATRDDVPAADAPTESSLAGASEPESVAAGDSNQHPPSDYEAAEAAVCPEAVRGESEGEETPEIQVDAQLDAQVEAVEFDAEAIESVLADPALDGSASWSIEELNAQAVAVTADESAIEDVARALSDGSSGSLLIGGAESNAPAPEAIQSAECGSSVIEARTYPGGSDAPRREGVEAAPAAAQQTEERRQRRRALISAPIRVRGVDVTKNGPDEISTTIDVSRSGILFVSDCPDYCAGMEVAVMFPYSDAPGAIRAEQEGRVARIVEMADGRRAVAVALGVGIGEHLVDASGRKFADVTVRAQANVEGRETKRPLVVAVDSNGALRESMKAYLQGEGYDVMALNNGLDAREILDMLAPALIVAEIEGEDMPGYDLCAHVKATRSLRHIPVVLTTSSAYPSDYSNAHKMGAVVCMAKPFKLERLGHVAGLLAPVPNAKCDPAAAPRKADPSRKACSAPHHGAGPGAQSKKVYDESTSPRRRLRFPSFR